MDFSLIIPAYNEEAYIGATLESVKRAARHAFSGKPAIEMIVVDNASTDGTAAVAASYATKLVPESQRNVARARNAGASAATADVLVFLDADTLVPESFFSCIAEIMRDARCLGGSADINHRPKRRWVHGYLALWRSFGRIAGMAQGAAQFSRRDAFASVGGYDERLFMGEDVDFYWRLRNFAKRGGELRAVHLRVAGQPVAAAFRSVARMADPRVDKSVVYLVVPTPKVSMGRMVRPARAVRRCIFGRAA